jgi:serine/threonine protein kinase/tetratricopeptide (TPR) repeat protein
VGTDQIDRLKSALAGRYAFDRELGQGAFASVYLARDLRHDRLVAIKVLHVDPSSELSEIRFLQEIRFLASLQHPNIVPVHDSGHVENLLYYVMPYVRGETVRERIRRERQLAISDAVRISCEVADALDYAHRQGVIHRDIKPENVLLSGSHAMLADFGVARAIDSARGDHLTRTGLASPGTPAYMSPEQILGERELDQRTDIYSLGCVLFEMVAGKPPFEGPTGLAKRFDNTAPSVREKRPAATAVLDGIIGKALSRSPTERFATASELCNALSSPAVQATPPLGAPTSHVAEHSETVIADAPQAIASTAEGRSSKAKRNVRSRLGLIAWTGTAILALSAAALVFRAIRPRHPVGNSPLDPRRIAVLDFEDQSPAHDLGYFASGLSASLTHELSSVSAIQVVSRNSIRAFRDRGASVDSLIGSLRIGSLVEGSVQRSGDRTRVTVAIVDATTNTQISSATVERKAGELFMLEDDLAHQVASLLRRRLGKELRVRETITGTRSDAARDLVFQADKIREDIDSTAQSDVVELGSALTSLQRADALLAAAESADVRWNRPLLARGWVALEVAQRTTGMPRLVAFDKAANEASLVLARAPVNAEALELRGTGYYRQAARLDLAPNDFDKRLLNAESDLRRALSIDSLLPTAWGTLSLVRVARGDVSQAERYAQTALSMDTYLQEAPTILGALYAATLMRGNTRDAWQWCNRGAGDFPQDARFIDCQLTLLAEDMSRPPDPGLAWNLGARAEDLDPPIRANAGGRGFLPIYRQMMIADVIARAGRADSARAVARRARAEIRKGSELDMDVRYEEAYLHLLLGERDSALSLLAEYVGERPPLRGLVARHPRWKPLWNEPAFVQLVARANESRK